MKKIQYKVWLIALLCLLLTYLTLMNWSISNSPKKYNKKSVMEDSPKEITSILHSDNVIKPESYYNDTTEYDDNQNVDMNFDISKNCGYSKEDLERILSNDEHKNMKPYIDSFLKAEKKYGVNALFLICQFGLESGWGTYKAGVNNIAGWTDGKGAFKNFDSVDDCIMFVAYKLSTFYKDTVGTRLEDVCSLYCPTKGYAEKVIRIMKEQEKVINQNI